MAYTINLTDGQLLTTIQDGTTDTSTSLTLAGANYVGYGQFLNENLVYLLENSASTSAPIKPIIGQLWFNTQTQNLEVYTATGFTTIPVLISTSVRPAGASTGDMWWDSVNYQLYVWQIGWQLVGPLYQHKQGITGAIPARLYDESGSYYDVIQLQTGGNVAAIINTGTSTFESNITINGFAEIVPGINLNSNYPNLFNGTAVNTENFNGLPSSDYLQLNQDITTTGNFNTTGNITFGANAAGSIKVASAITLQSQGKNINIATPAGTAISISGSTSLATVLQNPTAPLGIATKQYVDTNIGTVTNTVNSDIAAVDSTISNVSALLSALTIAFNSNITSISAVLETVASQAYVANAISAALPAGVIVMWSGDTSNIPEYYQLCDGTNGTPDFRDKFVVGAGNVYAPGAQGGSVTSTLSIANLPLHSHTFSNSISVSGSAITANAGGHTHIISDPGHHHTMPLTNAYGPYTSPIGLGNDADVVDWPTSNATTGISISTAPNHQHNVTIQSGGVIAGNTGLTGSAIPFSILPSYYAKCWIMKMV